MKDILVLLVLVVIVSLALGYIIKAKKKGQKCIGCPYEKECSEKCSCNKFQ